MMMRIAGSRLPVLGLMMLMGLLLGGTSQAATHSGTLYTNGYQGFDWYYPSVLAKSRSTLLAAGGTLKLQSRFIWNGSAGFGATEHAIVAYSQGAQSTILNSPNQSPRQPLFRYGAGAFVGKSGLALELWSVPSYAGNYDDTTVAWTANAPCASNGHCIETISLSNAQTTILPEYITYNGGFTLREGQVYWVRITLTGEGSGWVRLRGELFVGSTLFQVGQVRFELGDYLPLTEQLKGSLGRTPGNDLITYNAYDTF